MNTETRFLALLNPLSPAVFAHGLIFLSHKKQLNLNGNKWAGLASVLYFLLCLSVFKPPFMFYVTFSISFLFLFFLQSQQAPWSPRVGAGLVSHWYFNTSRGETVAQSKERIVLAGTYET